MNNIVLPVPENYEMEEITITYRRSSPFPLVKTLPVKESKLLSGGGMSKESPKKGAKRKHIYRKWDDEYIIQNAGQVPWAMMADHLGVDVPALTHRADYLKRKQQIPTRPRTKTTGVIWTDDEDLYLAEHYMDPIAELIKHLGKRTKRAIECRISNLRKQGLIKDSPAEKPADNPPAATPAAPEPKKPGLLARASTAVASMFTTPAAPPELGDELKDFKMGKGVIVAIDPGRQVATVKFWNDEIRRFNFDGCRRMIEAYKEGK